MEKEHFEIILESLDSKMDLVLEAFKATNQKIDDKTAELKEELKEDIAVLDCKIMGLSKRVDSVEERLSAEIAEVKADLAEVKADLNEHRTSTELHHAPRKRPLKRA